MVCYNKFNEQKVGVYMEIVILDWSTVSNGDLSLDCFKKFGNVISYDFSYPEEIEDRIKNADIVITNKCRLNETNLKGTNVKLICLFATGFDNIDTKYCAESGIVVCNAPDYSTNSVAQCTFALILQFFSNISEYSQSVKEGNWTYSKTFSYFLSTTHELSNKTIGIIGYGNIGKKVALIAEAFGMNILVYTRSKHTDTDSIKFVDLETLLKNSDIVSLHTPLTPDTKNLIDSKALSLMKSTAYLINTSRGPVIDEVALSEALKENKIAGAGLDVIAVEPMQSDCPLLNLDNCIITPHIAWAAKEARERLLNIICDNIEHFTKGNYINKVN